jgi:hypothetical protein
MHRALALVALASLVGCATADDESYGVVEEELGPPIQLLAIGYDGVDQILGPCGLISNGIHTAVAQGAAEFVVRFEASYTSLGQVIQPCGTFFLSTLKSAPYDDQHHVVEMALPAPEPDDLGAIEASLTMMPSPLADPPKLKGGGNGFGNGNSLSSP